MTMKQLYSNYNAADFLVWKTLFERQEKNLKDKACSLYLKSLKEMSSVLHADAIPKFEELNQFLAPRTGWEIEVVPGLIPVDEFFALMAERKFCSSTWLRSMKQLDYLEEPDMFHDIFGHVPLLVDKGYADLMQRIGKLGVQFKHDALIIEGLERFYWFTIEFGLILESDKRNIYGAGIISSFGESKHIFESTIQCDAFDIDQILETDFDKSSIQQRYYEISSMEEMQRGLDRLEEIAKGRNRIKKAS